MENGKDRKGRFYVYAALWGVPGLLILSESYRLLQKPRQADFFVGPVGYMTGVGLLLMGFCIWEIIAGLKTRAQETKSTVQSSKTVKKVLVCIASMVLFLVLRPDFRFKTSGNEPGALFFRLRNNSPSLVNAIAPRAEKRAQSFPKPNGSLFS